jgi:hypothetical protein
MHCDGGYSSVGQDVDGEVGLVMATGRIRRTARRGIAAAVLVWLGVAALAVLLAPTATAAPAVTVEIKNLTPPAASVDPGGTVTFLNKIPPQNKGGISVPLVGTFSATVFTDVSVTFFGQKRDLALDQSARWTFTAPATTGTIAYTYRIVPEAGLTADVANQVVDAVAAGLPALPAPTPFAVQTIAPAVPTLPGLNVPQLPQVNVTPPDLGQPPVDEPRIDPPSAPPSENPPAEGPSGDPYRYGTGVPPMSPTDATAAAAFDPQRFFVPGESLGTADRAGSGGSGGVAGSYDGASVPVFGQLAGLDGAFLDEEGATTNASSTAPAAQALPAAALAAILALAAVTAALVRTHHAQRSSR